MIRPGDTVRLHYTTTSLEGVVIESTRERGPIEFVAGSPDIIRGLSDGVIGLRAGETRSFSVAPEQAFGRQRSDLVQSVPLACLPEGTGPGDQLAACLGDITFDVWVRRTMTCEAQLDANHPLAGETLLIDVEVVDVSP